MKKAEERRLREQNAELTVQVQDSKKRIAELEDRVRGLKYAEDAASEGAERIRELRLRIAELEEENSRLRAKPQNSRRGTSLRSRRVVKKMRKALKTRL